MISPHPEELDVPWRNFGTKKVKFDTYDLASSDVVANIALSQSNPQILKLLWIRRMSKPDKAVLESDAVKMIKAFTKKHSKKGKPKYLVLYDDHVTQEDLNAYCEHEYFKAKTKEYGEEIKKDQRGIAAKAGLGPVKYAFPETACFKEGAPDRLPTVFSYDNTIPIGGYKKGI